MILSIIITVYNLGKYIDRCIQSFISQNIPFDEYEIIVVDDGSSDNSAEKIKNYSEKYPHIKYIYKNNGGASSARNLGLKYAKGDYIWFFDGDDWVGDNILTDIKQVITETYSDIIFLNYIYIDEGFNVLYESNFKLTGEISGTISGHDLFIHAPGDFIMPHRFIIKRELLIKNYISFIEGITFEDDEWAPRVLYYANSCIVYEKPLYYYLKRGNSLMSAFSEAKIPSFIKVVASLSDFRDNIKDNQYKKRLNAYILTYVSNYLRLRKKRNIRTDCDIKALQAIKYIDYSGISVKKYIQCILMKYAPTLYSNLFAIKQ